MSEWTKLFQPHPIPHSQFQKTGTAVLPIGSKVFKVFGREDLSKQTMDFFCDYPIDTIHKWIVREETVAMPLNLQFDTRNKQWHNKLLAEHTDLEELLLIPLWEPVKAAMQGRLYVGFLLFKDDLVPY